MRTTVDLPDDLHRTVKAIARDAGQAFSETVATLIRRGLGQGGSTSVESRNELTGFPTFDVGRVITSEDVRALEDEM